MQAMDYKGALLCPPYDISSSWQSFPLNPKQQIPGSVVRLPKDELFRCVCVDGRIVLVYPREQWKVSNISLQYVTGMQAFGLSCTAKRPI